MQEQRKALLALGVTAQRIHREVFGPDLLDHLL
jgi:nitric oxide dioxygenase